MKPKARSKAPADENAKQSPFTMTMGPPHREKLQQLLGFCLMNGVAATQGVIMRSLLEQAPEKSPELVRQVKAQLEAEKEETREKRREH